MFTNIVTFALFTLSVVSAFPAESNITYSIPDRSLCSLSGRQDLRRYFTEMTVDLVQVSRFYLNTDNITTTQFNITATLTIIDACTFQLDNLSLSSFPINTEWRGNVYWQNFPVQDGLIDAPSVRYSLDDHGSFTSIIDTIWLYQKAPGELSSMCGNESFEKCGYAGILLAYARFPINVSGQLPGENEHSVNNVTSVDSSATSGTSKSSNLWGCSKLHVMTMMIIVNLIIISM